jgi:hypothetical protein
MSTTTTEITADELRQQITNHEQEIAEAEREIGAAALDGKRPAAATKRARDGREAIRRCQAALAELERRETEAAEEARTGAASVARLASYESIVAYLELAETFLLRRNEYEAAKKAVEDFPVDRKFLAAKRGGRHQSPDESDLDTDLVLAVPDTWAPEYRKKGGVTTVLRGMTAERARELRGFAEARAEEERSGNGVDRSQPYGTWDQQMNELRKAERAEQLAAAGGRGGA